MTDSDFQRIVDLSMKYTGIALTDKKSSMVYGRISRRLRALKMTKFREYLNYLEANLDKELDTFINLMTTNLTSFFRENHHFEFLRKTLIPEWKSSRKTSLTIWSSGCSIGQEAYSIAMTMAEAGMADTSITKILATDLDSSVIETGRKAVYDLSALDSVPPQFKDKYFSVKHDKRLVKVADELVNLVHFKRLNLLEPWPIKTQFDLIFCRNVVIYFNKETQMQLFDRYADQLTQGGYLIIGHSESLKGLTDRFELIGKTIYRKIK